MTRRITPGRPRSTGARAVAVATTVTIIGIVTVVVAATLVLVRRGDVATAPGTESGAASSRPATSDPTSEPSSAARPDVTWTPVAGVGLPFSRVHGPRRTTGGAASGYSRSTTGAAIAAAQVLIRTSPGAGPRVFDPVLATQVTGVNLPAMRLATHDEYQRLRARAGVPDGAPAHAGTAQVRGYVVRAVDLAAGDATVDVVLTAADLGTQDRAVAFRVELRRQHDDWRVVAPANGDWGTAATPLGALPAGLVSYDGDRG